MQIAINFNFSIDIPNCKIDTLIGAFKKVLPLFLSEFIGVTVLKFAESYMSKEEKPFYCDKCGNNRNFIRKTGNAKPAEIITIFGETVPVQIQIQCRKCGHKMFITRRLPDICRYQKMSAKTRKILALTGSLTTFRVSEKLLGMFNIPLDKITVWRCVQKVGEGIKFGLDLNEAAGVQADGTGILIQGIKKKGKE